MQHPAASGSIRWWSNQGAAPACDIWLRRRACLRVRHILIMSSSSSRKRCSSSRTVSTRVLRRWCRVLTRRTRSRFFVMTCRAGRRHQPCLARVNTQNPHDGALVPSVSEQLTLGCTDAWPFLCGCSLRRWCCVLTCLSRSTLFKMTGSKTGRTSALRAVSKHHHLCMVSHPKITHRMMPGWSWWVSARVLVPHSDMTRRL